MNCLTVLGRLGRDPSSKQANGKTVCAFSLAVENPARKDAPTLWLEVRAWGKLADNCQKFLAKGRQVFIVGELEVQEWLGRDNQKHSEFRLTALRVKFLGGGEQKSADAPRTQVPDDEIPF